MGQEGRGTGSPKRAWIMGRTGHLAARWLRRAETELARTPATIIKTEETYRSFS
jgi:hypothetical protein